MPQKTVRPTAAATVPTFGIKRILKTPFWIEVVEAANFTTEQQQATWEIHQKCFPEVQDQEDTLEDYLQKATFLHNPQDCIWMIIWKQFSDSTGGVSEARTAVGMATVIPYTDSLYVFNMGVVPEERKQGLGERLLREAQQLAIKLNLLKLSGSVDSSQKHLISFYRRLGAKLVRNNHVSSDKRAPPTVRLETGINPGQATLLLGRCERRISTGLAERNHTAVVHNTAGVAAVALLGILLMTKLFGAVLRAGRK